MNWPNRVCLQEVGTKCRQAGRSYNFYKNWWVGHFPLASWRLLCRDRAGRRLISGVFLGQNWEPRWQRANGL